MGTENNIQRWIELLVNANIPQYEVQRIVNREVKNRGIHVHVETRKH